MSFLIWAASSSTGIRIASWRVSSRIRRCKASSNLETRLGLTRAELVILLDAVRHSLVEKPDTVELIRELQQRGVPLYCLSNMPVAVCAHLQNHHTLWDVFSGIAPASVRVGIHR